MFLNSDLIQNTCCTTPVRISSVAQPSPPTPLLRAGEGGALAPGEGLQHDLRAEHRVPHNTHD